MKDRSEPSLKRNKAPAVILAALFILNLPGQMTAFAPTGSSSSASLSGSVGRTVGTPRIRPFEGKMYHSDLHRMAMRSEEFCNDESLPDCLPPPKNKNLEKEENVGKKHGNGSLPFAKRASNIVATSLLASSLILSPEDALAAQSGGRIGGESFSSTPTTIRTSPRTYSTPMRSYGSSGYSAGYSRGFASGYYSRGPGIMINPFAYSSPIYAPQVYSRPVVVSSGPGAFDFILLGGAALIALNAISGFGSNVKDSIDSNVGSALGNGVSVVQLSVALDVPRRDDPNSILNVLGRLARTAKTDSRVGIENLTSQVALELLRHKESIIAGSSKYSHHRNIDAAKREYNNRSVQERSKFERETASNYKGVDYSSLSSGASAPSNDRYSPQATTAVVTILLTIQGDTTKMPNINSVRDIEAALQRIASDSRVDDCLQSAEILWTPEERCETLTPREVFADYPSLRSV